MKNETKYLQWAEYYVVANEVILGIFSLYSILNEYVGLSFLYEDGVGSVLRVILYVLSIVGFPILSFVSQFSPAMGDWEVRKIGIVISIGFVVLAAVLFEIIRRLLRSIREQGVIQQDGVRFVGYILTVLSITVFIQFAGTFFVGTQAVGGYYARDFMSQVELYFSMILASIPFVSIVLLGGVWVIRKMYAEAVELKKDQELTV